MLLAIGLLSKLLIIYWPTIKYQPCFLHRINHWYHSYLLRISHFKSRFQVKHYAVVALGIIILVIITLLNHGDTHANTSLTLNSSLIIKYFIAGMCASSAMLLPGISGSFMLLVFGAYGTVMFAISELMSFNFQAISLLFVVGLGIVAGFICSSKVIHYALHHYPTLTFALIIGFVIGSVLLFSQECQ